MVVLLADSNIVDMLLYYRKETATLTKKQLGNRICGFVALILQPEFIPEVILSLNKLSPKTANIVFPLIR